MKGKMFADTLVDVGERGEKVAGFASEKEWLTGHEFTRVSLTDGTAVTLYGLARLHFLAWAKETLESRSAASVEETTSQQAKEIPATRQTTVGFVTQDGQGQEVRVTLACDPPNTVCMIGWANMEQQGERRRRPVRLGHAYCAPGDAWSTETGMRLALRRANCAWSFKTMRVMDRTLYSRCRAALRAIIAHGFSE